MAGRPKLRMLMSTIESRGGIDWLCGEIENGRTLTKIADELGVSRNLMYKYLKQDDAYRPKFEEARHNSAHTLVDEARDLVDDSNIVDMPKVREQVKMRQWSAERFNRDSYGQPKDTGIQVSIGELHLNAMRRHRQLEEVKVTNVLPSDSQGETPVEITNVLPEESAVSVPSPDGLDESLELSPCDETPNVDVT